MVRRLCARHLYAILRLISKSLYGKLSKTPERTVTHRRDERLLIAALQVSSTVALTTLDTSEAITKITVKTMGQATKNIQGIDLLAYADGRLDAEPKRKAEAKFVFVHNN